MDKTDRLRDYGLAFLLYEQGLGICGYELIRELFIFIKLILNSYLDVILKNWPEYLRLGINTYFQYNLNKKRVTERILVHALQKYCEENNEFPDEDSIDVWLAYEGNNLLNYVNDNDYPQMVIDKLNEVVEYKRNM